MSIRVKTLPAPLQNVEGFANGGLHGAWGSTSGSRGIWDNTCFGSIDLVKDWVQTKDDQTYHREVTGDKRPEVASLRLKDWQAKGFQDAPIWYQSSMAVDSDGGISPDRAAAYPDDERQSSLALALAKVNPNDPKEPVQFPDATQIPYVVLPQEFYRTHPQIKLGDLVAVLYNPGHPVMKDGKPVYDANGLPKIEFSPADGRVAYGIYGDQGGTYRTKDGKKVTQIGESSMLTAQQVGVNADPNAGGTPNGVTYIVFPNSASMLKGMQGGGPLPRDVTAQDIAAAGQQLFQKLGGHPPKQLPSPFHDFVVPTGLVKGLDQSLKQVGIQSAIDVEAANMPNDSALPSRASLQSLLAKNGKAADAATLARALQDAGAPAYQVAVSGHLSKASDPLAQRTAAAVMTSDAGLLVIDPSVQNGAPQSLVAWIGAVDASRGAVNVAVVDARAAVPAPREPVIKAASAASSFDPHPAKSFASLQGGTGKPSAG